LVWEMAPAVKASLTISACSCWWLGGTGGGAGAFGAAHVADLAPGGVEQGWIRGFRFRGRRRLAGPDVRRAQPPGEAAAFVNLPLPLTRSPALRIRRVSRAAGRAIHVRAVDPRTLERSQTINWTITFSVRAIGLERGIQKGKISRQAAKSQRRLLGESVSDARDAVLDQGHFEVYL
jgi:hypothetical protein